MIGIGTYINVFPLRLLPLIVFTCILTIGERVYDYYILQVVIDCLRNEAWTE